MLLEKCMDLLGSIYVGRVFQEKVFLLVHQSVWSCPLSLAPIPTELATLTSAFEDSIPPCAGSVSCGSFLWVGNINM